MAYWDLMVSASTSSCSNELIIIALDMEGFMTALILPTTYEIVIASKHLDPCLLAHSSVCKMMALNPVGPVTDMMILATSELMGSIEMTSVPVVGMAFPALPQAKFVSLYLIIL